MTNWLTLTFQCVLGFSLVMMISGYMAAFFGAMWIPSSQKTIRQMLELADLQPGQHLVDLGAGDGRIVIMAARAFQVTAVGVEIDPLRYLLANALIMLLGLRRQARIHYANVFHFDLTGADAVIIYLTKPSNARLKPHLASQLQPGARVVSRFAIPGWTPLALDDRSMVFLYEIGNTGPEIQTKLL